MLETDAWYLHGPASTWGRLRLIHTRLAFGVGGAPGSVPRIAPGEQKAALRYGEPFVLFDESVSELRFHQPWYYFGGGMIVGFGGTRYRLSFGPPAHAQRTKSLLAAADELSNLRNMRRVGRLWAQTLGELQEQGAKTDTRGGRRA